jgi:hypothetical protein
MAHWYHLPSPGPPLLCHAGSGFHSPQVWLSTMVVVGCDGFEGPSLGRRVHTCSKCGSSPTQSQAGLSSVQYMSLHSLFSSTQYRHSMSCSATMCHPSHSDMAGSAPHTLRLTMRMSSTASRVLCAAVVCPRWWFR